MAIFAGRLAMRAGQHLDEGGFAGAIVAEQRQHLAALDVEIDAIERRHGAELLADPARGEQSRHAGPHTSLVAQLNRLLHSRA